MAKKNKLCYYVYIENISQRKIEKYNVLNDSIVKEIRKRTKGISDKSVFAKIVEQILTYHYWSRAEWEIILTDWPSRISVSEISRLNQELDFYRKEYNSSPYSLTVNLATEEKVDVYDQVKLNWDIFINYLWENLK
jgi:hypothetical protein